MKIIKTKESSWLVYDNDKGILVDTGLHHCYHGILKIIDARGVKDLTIFLTHTHFDHSGSAEEIRKATGAKVLVSAKEAKYLSKGYTPVPRGTDFIRDLLSRTAHTIHLKSVEHYMPVTDGIVALDGSQSLKDYGFDAEAVPLGGHTEGSIGLKMGDHFFVGDTMFGVIGDLYPLFADFADELQSAWETILDSKSKYIYPGHGKIVERTRLEDEYMKRYGHRSNL